MASLTLIAVLASAGFLRERLNRQVAEANLRLELVSLQARYDLEARSAVEDRERVLARTAQTEAALRRELEIAETAIRLFQHALEASRAELAALKRIPPSSGQ